MELVKAEQIAKEKMLEHGLSDWEFYFDESVSRRGACHWERKMISLSKALTEIREEKFVINTILHEIAHALCGRIEMHSDRWRQKALSIGCDGTRCSNDGVMVAKPFKATCSTCGYSWKSHRQTRLACSNCCKKFNDGVFDRKYLVKWTKV